MKYTLYPGIGAMLAPEALSTLEGRPIMDVRCSPFDNCGLSGSSKHFLAVETNGGHGTRYLVKRISTEWDWIMRGTDDRHGREVAIWQHGLLDRLPAEIAHVIVACAVDGPGWAILMRDVRAALLPYEWNLDQPLSTLQNDRCLDGLAALHATFWEVPEVADSAFGLCSLRALYTLLTPETGRREAGGSDEITQEILKGWDLFKTLVEPDIASVIYELLEDPQPLCDALGRYPQTLVHGDPRPANLGLVLGSRPQVILLDWALACVAPPAVDLAWYLGDTILPVSQEEIIAYYRRALARRLGDRFDERWWQPQLELSLLADVVRQGWSFTSRIVDGETEIEREYWQSRLAWWSKQVRAGVRWLR